MTNLAISQQTINPIDLANLWIDNKMTQPFTQEALLKTVVHFLKSPEAKQQFLQQLQTIRLMSFPQQNTLTTFDLPITTSIDKETDRLWLVELEEQVIASMTTFEFTLDRLSRLIYLSPRQIRRRLKQLTGKTFSQYLKEARLKKAHHLLMNQEIKSIKKLAYQVGLRDVKYFSKQFKEYYGNSPSAFLA